ncbi:class I SAM-dependent methyltransferase [Xanthovirga aplysinae]|uniref:class I SAM-dependent methyltransferase n=1 Tax=Xanthovirga aplysinae TaxID=2529853 RepID=UPI0012BD5DAC|nr:class I SAM-dependent methyltransferase [Xanthovirga aplysinae]MTI31866.1 class I SAM-dependent methyltransferase [Xanthovirga aplysinae]
MNDLEQYFQKNEKRLIHKWNHYFDIYDRHFKKFRKKNPVILEIGVSQGGSLQMWKHYFGEGTKIYGIDIEPRCKKFEEENIEILIGSQSDRRFLREIKSQIPKIDILIDDGGHTMKQQIVSFQELFDHIKDDGVYLCEDLHTSYWHSFGGGHKRIGTFIEYSKNFIDHINAYHSTQNSLKVNGFTKSVNSLHYYDSILVIEKNKREKPYDIKSGESSFEYQYEGNKIKALKRRTLLGLNYILGFFRLPWHWR